MAFVALQVLNGSGHLTLEWDHTNPEEVEKIRQEVETLKAAGYTFFLVNDVPADEVTAGAGKLLVKRLDDVVTELAAAADATPEIDVPVVRRRGRPPAPKAEAVAVRPQRGG